jgi:large subunit ribosomal protein L14
MKPIKARLTRSLSQGTRIVCADNTGAKELEIISAFGYKGVKRRKPRAGIADKVKASVKKGNVKMRKTMVDAVIVRVKQQYRRKNGTRVKFEDNAAVLINEKGEAIGTQIKGPVAREAVERFSSIGKIASTVV